MHAFVAVYLALGFFASLGLFGWLAVASVRRDGFRNAVRGGARAYFRELPLYWRVPVVAWTFLIAAPIIAAWAIAAGQWDPVGATFVAILSLAYLSLLRWHLCAEGAGSERTSWRPEPVGRDHAPRLAARAERAR